MSEDKQILVAPFARQVWRNGAPKHHPATGSRGDRMTKAKRARRRNRLDSEDPPRRLDLVGGHARQPEDVGQGVQPMHAGELDGARAAHG